MASTVWWRDAAELTAAAHGLGIAHPTGFPLYLLLGKLLDFLPFGSTAIRLNLLSSLAAALTTALLFRLAMKTYGVRNGLGVSKHFASLAAVAIFVLGPTFFIHAVTAEIYGLNILIVLLAIYLCAGLVRHFELRWAFLLAFLLGLGTGVHAIFRLVILVLMILLGANKNFRTGIRGHLGLILMLFIWGMAVQLYLPLASMRNPALDWGNPEFFGTFWNHLSAARIRRAFADQILSSDFTQLASNLLLYLRQLISQFSWPGLALSLAGAIWLWRGGRALLLATAGLLLLDTLYSTWINPMGLADRQNGLLAILILSWWIGAGIAALSQGILRFFNHRPEARVMAGAAALFTALALSAYSLGDQLAEKMPRGDYIPREYAADMLISLPTGAMVITQSDDLSALLLYLQNVNGLRPDVTHVVRQHVWDANYFLKKERAGTPLLEGGMKGRYLSWSERERIAHQGVILKALRDSSRPVYWEFGMDLKALSPTWLPRGALFQPSGRASSASGRHPSSFRQWVKRLLFENRSNPESRRVLSRLFVHRGLAAAQRGAFNLGSREIISALQVDRANHSARLNLAVFLERSFHSGLATGILKAVVEASPENKTALGNYALLLLKVGADHLSRKHYLRLLTLAPDAPRALVGLGILAARKGQYAKARLFLEKGLKKGAKGEDGDDARANLRILRRIDK